MGLVTVSALRKHPAPNSNRLAEAGTAFDHCTPFLSMAAAQSFYFISHRLKSLNCDSFS